MKYIYKLTRKQVWAGLFVFGVPFTLFTWYEMFLGATYLIEKIS